MLGDPSVRYVCLGRAIKRAGRAPEIERFNLTVEAATKQEAYARCRDRYSLPPYTAVQIDEVWEYR